MTDSVRKADYFYVEAANQARAGAAYLKVLRDAGVDLLACTGFPAGRKAQIDFIPEDTAVFRAAAQGFKPTSQGSIFLKVPNVWK